MEAFANYLDYSPVYVGFSASSGAWYNKLLGATIRMFTGGDTNHAFIVYFDYNWRCWLVVGANANGLTFENVDVFLKDHNIVHMFAANHFYLWDGLAAHSKDLNKGYNYTGLFNMAWVEIGKKITGKPWGNHLSDDDRIFCSEWVTQVIKSALAESNMTGSWNLCKNGYHDDQVDPTFLEHECIGNPTLFPEIDPKVLDKPWNQHQK